jgi:hypothetical protein
MIIFTYLNNKQPDLILQNFCIFNLFSFYFISTNFDLMILGLFNILVLITIYGADDDTYNSFSVWFDILGIYPYDYNY